MRFFLINGLLILACMASQPLFADKTDSFEKGFHIGICKTLLENFKAGDRSINNFQFYITNSKGIRIVTFNLEKSLKRLKELYENENSRIKEKINKFLELIDKYRTGEIKAKEISIFNSLYYFLIYRSNRDSIKYGFLTAGMYTSVIFIKTEGISDTSRKNAYSILWSSIDKLLLFSPYIFTSKNSDELYMAYMNRDIKKITGIAILIIVSKLKIKIDIDPVM